jgi:hypothetical protein
MVGASCADSVDDPTLGAMSQGRGHEIDDSGPLAELVRGSFEEAVEWSTIQRSCSTKSTSLSPPKSRFNWLKTRLSLALKEVSSPYGLFH